MKKEWLIKIVMEDTLKVLQQKRGDWTILEEMAILDILKQRKYAELIKKFEMKDKGKK